MMDLRFPVFGNFLNSKKQKTEIFVASRLDMTFHHLDTDIGLEAGMMNDDVIIFIIFTYIHKYLFDVIS